MPEKDDFTAWQLSNYKAVLRALETLGFGQTGGAPYGKQCLYSQSPGDLFRYGSYGRDDVWPLSRRCIPEGWPVEASTDTKSPRCSGEQLPAGAAISYGCTAVTSRPTKIAVVTAGYAELLSEKSQ